MATSDSAGAVQAESSRSGTCTLSKESRVANSLSNFAASPIVTILVGKEKAKYIVHKDVLVQESQFFERCLASGMQEAQTHIMELPDEDPKTFDHLIDWIYLRKVIDAFPTRSDEMHNSQGAERLPGDGHLYQNTSIETMEAWILADKLGMPGWQNYLLGSLREHWRFEPRHGEDVSWAIDHVEHESSLFRFVIQQFDWEVTHGHYGARVNVCELLHKGAFEISNVLQPAISWAKKNRHALPPIKHLEKYFVDY